MLETIFTELEANCFSEGNILEKLKSIPNNENHNLKTEIIAFQFMENNQNNSDWGTYFGSHARFPQQDGSVIEIPSIKEVDMNMINYWSKRILQVTNPVFKARYSGLVYDLSSHIIKINPPYDIVVVYIESLIQIVERRLQGSIDLIRKIKRAVFVAISINHKILISASKKAMLELEDEIGVNDKPGLWGFSFDVLINTTKSFASSDEQSYIIRKLETRLTEVCKQETLNTWASECIIKRLAPYYKKTGRLLEAQRVLRTHGITVKSKDYTMLLQYQGALKELQKLYAEYGMKQESDELLKNIKEIGVKVLDEMQLITSEVQFTKEEIDAIIIPVTLGTKEQVFHKLILFFTPQRERVIDSLNKNARNNIFSNFFGTSIIDDTGREIANIGTLENDLIGNILHHISQDLQFNSFYTNKIFDRLIIDLNFSVDDFIGFVKESPVISNSRLDIIKKGIQSYFDKDYVVCEHLLIPQIETSIRNLIEQNNGVVLEPSALDAFQLKTFNKLLLDDIVKYTLGEDIQLYFRALFTDPRGWNLRNKICHGLIEPSDSTRSTSERVLHSLLIIGTLRKVTT